MLTTDQEHSLRMIVRAEVRSLNELSEKQRGELIGLTVAHEAALAEYNENSADVDKRMASRVATGAVTEKAGEINETNRQLVELQTAAGIAALVLLNVDTLTDPDKCAAYCKAQRLREACDKVAAAQIVTAEAQAELDALPE